MLRFPTEKRFITLGTAVDYKTYGSADITDDAVILLLLGLVVLQGHVDLVPTLLLQLLQGPFHFQLGDRCCAWKSP